MEIWDILDKDGNKTGKTIQKGEEIPEGYYHLGADIWIINSENKILIHRLTLNMLLRRKNLLLYHPLVILKMLYEDRENYTTLSL